MILNYSVTCPYCGHTWSMAYKTEAVSDEWEMESRVHKCYVLIKPHPQQQEREPGESPAYKGCCKEFVAKITIGIAVTIHRIEEHED